MEFNSSFYNNPTEDKTLPATNSVPTLRGQIKNHFTGNKRRYKIVSYILIILVIFTTGSLAGYFYATKNKTNNLTDNTNKSIHIAFLLEIYDKIKEYYWDKISDEQLASLYRLGSEKITTAPQQLNSPDREGVKNLLERILNPLDETKKKEFVVNLGDVVLANLNPFSRSRLYTTKKQQALQNEIKNIDPQINLYDILGVAKTASPDDIKKAFEQKSEPLKNHPSLEAQTKLAELNRAYQALGTVETKQKYDQAGAEPIIFTKITPPDIAYLSIKKISPTILQEFQKVVNELDKQTSLNTLILDLRDNIGGDMDTLPYFLGFFLGSNQYAYETFHQGDTKPFKTAASLLPSLARYKKIVVLINNGTQSSAEVIAATFKKYHIGVIVGDKSKGWGTIESIYPLNTQIDPNETYSMLMVHSVTLRDDGQPIEGRGVEPMVYLNDPKWPDKLLSYFNYPALVEAVKEVTKKVVVPNK